MRLGLAGATGDQDGRKEGGQAAGTLVHGASVAGR